MAPTRQTGKEGPLALQLIHSQQQQPLLAVAQPQHRSASSETRLRRHWRTLRQVALWGPVLQHRQKVLRGSAADSVAGPNFRTFMATNALPQLQPSEKEQPLNPVHRTVVPARGSI